jgi:integrase
LRIVGACDARRRERIGLTPTLRGSGTGAFESWAEVEAVAAQLGAVNGPMVIFAAATGLRPAELFALEHRDLDLEAGVVYVRRAYANGGSST